MIQTLVFNTRLAHNKCCLAVINWMMQLFYPVMWSLTSFKMVPMQTTYPQMSVKLLGVEESSKYTSSLHENISPNLQLFIFGLIIGKFCCMFTYVSGWKYFGKRPLLQCFCSKWGKEPLHLFSLPSSNPIFLQTLQITNLGFSCYDLKSQNTPSSFKNLLALMTEENK